MMTDGMTLFDAAIGAFRYYLPLELARYFISATLLFALVWLLKKTAWKSRQIQARNASNEDLRREIASSVMTCFLYLFIAIPNSWAFANGYFPIADPAMPWWQVGLTFIAMVFAHDAYFYWTHRAMHTRLLFKYVHRHHHRSVTPTPFTAYSFAVPEVFINALFVTLWLATVPTPPQVTLAFLTFQIIRNVTAHAGLELHPRWWLASPFTCWINTTTHHDLHHSGGLTTNFGTWFTFWDKMMGTEHPHYAQTFERVVAVAPPNVTAPPAQPALNQ
jgi:Delta7-sterol 5-desaturase